MNTEAEMGATCLSSVDIFLNSADLDIIPWQATDVTCMWSTYSIKHVLISSRSEKWSQCGSVLNLNSIWRSYGDTWLQILVMLWRIIYALWIMTGQSQTVEQEVSQQYPQPLFSAGKKGLCKPVGDVMIATSIFYTVHGFGANFKWLLEELQLLPLHIGFIFQNIWFEFVVLLDQHSWSAKT